MPGGRLASAVACKRTNGADGNARTSPASRVNAFAGYDDFAKSRDVSAGHSFWIPTPVSWRGSTSTSTPDPDVRTLGFIGNLDYPPNQLSLRQFLDSYGAALARRGLEVVVAGFGSDQVRGWGYPVRVLGPVANVSDFYEVIDAAVVPIDHGGGIKVKAIEALAHGRSGVRHCSCPGRHLTRASAVRASARAAAVGGAGTRASGSPGDVRVCLRTCRVLHSGMPSPRRTGRPMTEPANAVRRLGVVIVNYHRIDDCVRLVQSLCTDHGIVGEQVSIVSNGEDPERLAAPCLTSGGLPGRKLFPTPATQPL